MNFTHTDDRRMLADTLNRFIAEQYGMETRNHLAYGDAGHGPALYAQLAELGAIGALFPESSGGFGGAGFDISVVFECLGRGLLTEPLLGALLVGQALIAAGSEAQQARLCRLMDGTTIAALAHDEPGSHGELNLVGLRAERAPDGWTLNGAKGVVPFGDRAQLLLVSARTSGEALDPQGISLFLVDGAHPDVVRRGYGRIDGGRAAELQFDRVRVGPDALLGTEGQGHDLLQHIAGYALLALAAESIGAMDVARDQTIDYLRTRKQFGVAIGSFQALQHRMADLLLEIEQARSAVINAADAIDHADATSRQRALAAAKYTVGQVGTLVAEESIQLHGGIGMTWELPLSHYAKRLVMIDHQFGDADHHLQRFMALTEKA